MEYLFCTCLCSFKWIGPQFLDCGFSKIKQTNKLCVPYQHAIALYDCMVFLKSARTTSTIYRK